MIKQGDGVVVGVSGGADSVCLLTMLHSFSKEFDMRLYAVHVNHHIRGNEADEDQKYVVDLCRKLNVECICYDIDAAQIAREMKCSEEEAGREERYRIFREVKKAKNAVSIAVAHNLNDVSETILFNLFRGTGIGGLSGIKPVRDDIIRPILCLARREIEEYLSERNIAFRTDSTNLGTDYSRNKLRNVVIPYITHNLNPAADINIAKAGSSLLEIEDYLKAQTETVYDRYVSIEADDYYLSLSIKEEHPAIVKRVIRMIIDKMAGRLKDVTSLHIDIAMGLLGAETGNSADLPYGITVQKSYSHIIFKTKKAQKKYEKDEITDREIWKDNRYIENDIMTIEKVDLTSESAEEFVQNIPDLIYTKWIDCDKIKGTLHVRNRQQGDYITIDGAGNTKKLKDFFINEKIPRDERDNILLVADGSHIVWIIGYRLGSYYKVSKNTRQCLVLKGKVFEKRG
ncbi:MAG: tRNA lysidine(34) synthetase TilS [Lachnospiraceae bacterium]|nr:tRNA lysidine(34) synthetase TilS [Lachnospiraceae bacterium]